ncbi:HlyD family type I secretion periplasmic adaptor subunit [Cyanobium sp. BA5m-21]|uniref:HlyD family type I secretion periplasmic adaptor subunit n=1 Tax=unclassified Cyanobium TaxID=2627006 RepID=UPI0020CBA9DE|nr:MULTISPECIES: HlyD family type I secretion periplasmic adaptor subunit [unclassified Cyanobium]MCP9903373.1 HlyD family type I secretion periplasmic adaptor subunit [Cyanobium sp. BA5m-10]MCP9906226.1 HlyD family type I secretion periplasmic adaptor subunit [Cyanobium sp. BA5m-21]
MTSIPVNGPNSISGSDPADSSSLALPPAGGLLARLPGMDSPDAITLVGRSRLSQALELEEKPDNRYLRLSLYVLGAAALIFFPWAALTPITQVVNASGEVIPKGEVNVVQHLEGGIVSRVDVSDGDEVREGQVMLELRPNLVESEYRATEQQLKNLLLQQQQLQAAIRGERVLPPTEGIKQGNKVSQAQVDLLNSRMDNREDQIKAAQAVVGEKRAEVSGLNSQIALYLEQRAMWAGLVASGAASRLNLLDIDTKLAEMRGARNESLKALSQAEANLNGVQSGLVFEQNSQVAQLVNEEAVVAENIKKVRNQLERTKITAPVDGVVSDLRFKAPGGVVGPGAVVLSVVPNSTQRLVEVRVPSSDIGFVKPGQKVDVKLQPFDSTIYGSVPGRVLSIGGNSVQDPDDRKYYYKARIQLDRQFVDVANRKYPISVGMPLVADIKGPQRSVLRYIFQPFTRTLDSALRESR